MSIIRGYVLDLMKRKKSKIMMTDLAAVKEFIAIKNRTPDDPSKKDGSPILRGKFLNKRTLVSVKTGLLH